MKFLCLAYGAEKDWKALTKDEQDALLAQDDVLRKPGALMAAVEPVLSARLDMVAAAWQGLRLVARLSALLFALTFAAWFDSRR